MNVLFYTGFRLNGSRPFYTNLFTKPYTTKDVIGAFLDFCLTAFLAEFARCRNYPTLLYYGGDHELSVTETLISKIVDENDVPALDRFGIQREHFLTDHERMTYDFVRKYSAENNGNAPSYAVLVQNVPDFTYIPAVTDSYEYLTRKLKETYGKRSIGEFLNDSSGEIARKYAEIGNSATLDDFVSALTSKLSDIMMRTNVRLTVGIDIFTHYDKFLTEYRTRKAGLSFKIWPSKFPSVNAAIGGGYYGGNMYTWYARSGRGKSVVTMEEAIEAAVNGATVLCWLMEMMFYEWMARAFSSLSARQGLAIATFNGAEYEGGFDNRALLSGKLTEEYEAQLETFVATLNDRISGRIIIRAVDDPDFRERSLRQLEADIREVGADVVVIDPIYYMDYEANTSKTAGGDVAATSKGLRRVAGSTGAVIHVITQAEENVTEKDDDGIRELKSPKRAEIKKTKAVLEDATNVFGIDTLAHEGRGVIEIGKGRSGGEDTRIEIVYLPNWGIVREPIAEDTAAKFVGNF